MNNGLSNYGGFYASNGYVGSRMSVRAWEAYEDGENQFHIEQKDNFVTIKRRRGQKLPHKILQKMF